MRDEMNEAWKVAGRSARWFAKNYPVIASFGALASVQRFVAVRGVRGGAWAAGVTGELLTAAARIGLSVWCARTVFADCPVPLRDVPGRVWRHGRSHPGEVAAGAALLAGLTVVSKVIPDVAIAQLDEASRRRASAWELAVKNVTVIPFTTVWMVIGMRHAVDQARP
ncbi:hypothetical protein DUY81_05290 [Acidipropionibacterium acidipropionici]|uniref:Uncharacterized protein n=1 Tax=Acidipropionibacterium acidipropionici TaxID=1748 RepID=A0AAC8YFR7_9ACTN|nr:hypothetical protein [Acidipropionibacterium acidipropionici]AMS05162.1 hypothetical protein AXH35_06475 [Acidipropionibacterium acidipropionici]AOZ46644.1 hypothetical protein A8L58_07940 [Acidipropionibacterium acidipropionici]AZP37292.1 hypothetical protein DUY81_05290 [Acidipropionibacterium acidipropionici]